jgi:hypothetical protein
MLAPAAPQPAPSPQPKRQRHGRDGAHAGHDPEDIRECRRRGQVLMVLDAMKMENNIVAAADGNVAFINAAQGASINAGDLLASLSRA